MDAHRVEVLHAADGDRGVRRVAQDLELDLVPADQRTLDEDLADRAGGESRGDADARLCRRLGEPTASAAEREGRAHHHRRAERLHEAHPVLEVLDHRALGDRLADARDEIPEPSAILRRPNGRQRRAQHAHAVSVENAGIVERHRKVQPGLPAEGRQQRVGPMLLDHPRQVRQRERADQHGAADVGIGHHGRGVRVDQDRLDALAPKRQAGLHAGIVELGSLADQDRTGADDEHLARHGHASACSTARSKMRAASIGPGAPSGWNWTDAIRPLR